MRVGLIAKKIGMSSIFNEKGERIPVTFLCVDNCQVVEQKTLERNGYNALVVGSGKTKTSKTSKPLRYQFAKLQVEPKSKLKEFRVSDDQMLDPAALLNADHFAVGQFVDVTATSIGKGFAGVMKRHNFRGLEASHGVSISHRSHGSTGGRQDPGKVFKNKKMAGHMGCKQVTVQNLQIVSLDVSKGLIIVKGAVPGSKGGCVYVKDAIKKLVSSI